MRTTDRAPAAGAQPPIVTTDGGQLRGTVDGDVVRHRAVPFAEPPVGDRRWDPDIQADLDRPR